MKNVFLLVGIALSVTAAALFASHTPICWSGFLFSVIVMAVLIWMQKKEQKKNYTVVGKTEYSLQQFEENLKELIKSINELIENKENENYLNKLENIIEKYMPDIDEYRIFLINQLGMADYTKISIPFSKGERLINRSISAAVDGYLEESKNNILKSINFIELTISEIGKIRDEQNN
jgi:hypothetical protein